MIVGKIKDFDKKCPMKPDFGSIIIKLFPSWRPVSAVSVRLQSEKMFNTYTFCIRTNYLYTVQIG